MTDPLVMVLSSLVIFHAITRLAAMPSVVSIRWRARLLVLSILLEVSGSLMAFGEAYMSLGHTISLALLLGALAISPLADQRMGPRKKAWVIE